MNWFWYIGSCCDVNKVFIFFTIWILACVPFLKCVSFLRITNLALRDHTWHTKVSSKFLISKRTTLLTQKNINYEAFCKPILGFRNPRKLFKRKEKVWHEYHLILTFVVVRSVLRIHLGSKSFVYIWVLFFFVFRIK